ncbi:hypothetical protein GCM10010430_78420 [Kitasatospora cystarginea]|uniref:Amidohydrolase 3 domain-containing protein n=1 Tax=Kitasatospora cystarginea TaxID=58350 RepID=A0ABP5S033_9ACTN
MSGSLVSLAAFLVGAAAAGRLESVMRRGSPHRWLRATLVTEAALLAAAAVCAFATNGRGAHALIALIALAMGLRNGNGAGENLTWSAADFENFTEPRPELGSYESDFEKAVRLLMENGWGFRLHATYDETIRRDLAVFEKLAADGLFPAGNRWLFDHAETVSRDSLDRVAALGGALSVQNRMSFQGEAFVRRYGAGAAAEAPPVRAMLERGLTVGAGTDATRVSSYNPWVALHWLVAGRTVGDLTIYPPQNRVDRATALTMYTRAGAELTGEQDVKGILKPGFYGDLAILSDDFFTVPEQDIAHIESVLTVTGGRIVYAAAEYEGIDEAVPPINACRRCSTPSGADGSVRRRGAFRRAARCHQARLRVGTGLKGRSAAVPRSSGCSATAPSPSATTTPRPATPPTSTNSTTPRFRTPHTWAPRTASNSPSSSTPSTTTPTAPCSARPPARPALSPTRSPRR